MTVMNSASLDAGIIRNSARGQWLSILNALASELEAAIRKPGRHVVCPVHGGRDGFRLFKDAEQSGGGICNSCGPRPDGFSLLMWLKDWDFPTALESVASVIGHSKNGPVKRLDRLRPVPKTIAYDNRTRKILSDLWAKAIPAGHPDAAVLRRYLSNRGLDVCLSQFTNLKFHPELQYWDDNGKYLGNFPGMLALVSSAAGEPLTIHRTYLTPDGQKAAVESPKKLMAVPKDKSLSGSAIRLGGPGRLLCVAEGIETALAVSEATGMVTWALISAALMECFEIPEGVEKLILWADLDRNERGLLAAEILASKAEGKGIQAVVRLPSAAIPDGKKGVDWLDVLNEKGMSGFCAGVSG